MSFVSPEFALAALLFFPIYWLLHRRQNLQQTFLLVSGYLLYATWSLLAAAMLGGYSLFIWLAGNWINAGTDSDKGKSRLRLAIGLVVSLSLLLVTKYYEFLREGIGALLPGLGLANAMPVLDIVAPAGISFFTFQAITYLVWRYRAPPEAISCGRPFLFLSFWPTLFAGPILRADAFFKQAETCAGLPVRVERAIYFILLGLAQKMVFATWLAETFVDDAFRYSDHLDALQGVSAMWAYALQIFLDFSGYSLIVTGLALLLGYEIPRNFRQPYIAVNLRDFWRRWHISLSTFIRDYIYIPLGGSHAGTALTCFNIFIAMTLSGIWHGANTTFLIWGALHGLGMVVVVLLGKWNSRLFTDASPIPNWLGQTLTLLFVTVAWVFFRASTLEAVQNMFTSLTLLPSSGPSPQHILLVIFSAIFLLLTQYADALEARCEALIAGTHPALLYALTSTASFVIIAFGPSGVPAFIYYSF
jgi:D-alanyl-lipoteichoic acid acyltransferase DltB (MBOAT superfamily)